MSLLPLLGYGLQRRLNPAFCRFSCFVTGDSSFFHAHVHLVRYLLVGGMFYYFVEGPYELEHAGRWEAHFNATMSEVGFAVLALVPDDFARKIQFVSPFVDFLQAIALLRSGNITQADFDAIETAVNATVAATKQNKMYVCWLRLASLCSWSRGRSRPDISHVSFFDAHALYGISPCMQTSTAR